MFHPVKNSRNYLYAQFSFLTSDWNKYPSKTALFKANGIDPIAVLIDNSGKCIVPWEVLEKDQFTVSCYAGDLITVDVATVKMYESGYASGRDVKDPTPTIYEQVMQSFDDTKKYVTGQANKAKSSAEAAKDSERAASTYASEANSAADRAKEIGDAAVSEISQSKQDAVKEVNSAADNGVIGVNLARDQALKEISDKGSEMRHTGDSYLGQISETSKAGLAGINKTISDGLKSISDAGETQTNAVNQAGSAQTKAVNDAGSEKVKLINDAGTSRLSEINTAGQKWVSDINQGGEYALSEIQEKSSEAINSIETAKQESVQAVTDEGNTQIELIRQEAYGLIKIDEVEKIAIKEQADGKIIQIDDSAEWRFKGINLYGRSTQETTTGKNLFDPDLFVDAVINKYSENYITTFDGRKALYININANLPNINLYGNFKSGTSYYLSFMVYPLNYKDTMLENNRTQGFDFIYSDGTDVKIGIRPINNPINQWSKVSSGATDPNKQLTSLIATCGYTGKCYIDLDSIQLEESATATSYEPYTGGIPAPNPDYPMPIKSVGSEDGDVEVRVGGKNLITYPYISSQGVIDGLSYVIDEDHSISITGKNTVGTNFWLANPVRLKPGKYTLSGMGLFDSNAIALRIYNTTSHIVLANLVGGRDNLTFLVNEEQDVRIYLNIGNADSVINGTCYPMLEYGDTATPYEPYKTPQFITANTPNGLPGIPVTSDGNYTDENDQQWICDEIDFERGMYVKRIDQHVWNTSDSTTSEYPYTTTAYPGICRWSWTQYIEFAKIDTPLISDKLIYVGKNEKRPIKNSIQGSNNNARAFIWVDESIDTREKFYEFMMAAKMYYILATPVEIPLTDEELSQYKSAHTNNPTTVITNDEDAYMKTEYVADTKKYISNQHTTLEQRILALEENAIGGQ